MGALVPRVEAAMHGYNRPDRRDGWLLNFRPTFAWRKGFREAQAKVRCPHCGRVGNNCAHLCYPGSFHCWSCKGQWFQSDLTVSPAMVKNPEAA